jgi:hypothetical protein
MMLFDVNYGSVPLPDLLYIQLPVMTRITGTRLKVTGKASLDGSKFADPAGRLIFPALAC